MRTPASDAWLTTLVRVEKAANDVADVLPELAPTIPHTIDTFARGVPLSQMIRPDALRRRRRMVEAFVEMSEALAQNRAAAVRVLVDDEHMSIADVARLYGIPRQIASRLYHSSP